MNGDVANGKKVRYIGPKSTIFKYGEIYEVGLIKHDPKEKWYSYDANDGEGEFAFPSYNFEVID